MSCITLTDPQCRLLTALTGGPRRVDDLDNRESLDELRRWRWVFGGEWVELTGAGCCHAGTVVCGLIGGSDGTWRVVLAHRGSHGARRETHDYADPQGMFVQINWT